VEDDVKRCREKPSSTSHSESLEQIFPSLFSGRTNPADALASDFQPPQL
jgi:hypothetical protein